jgi:hypothetical protein
MIRVGREPHGCVASDTRQYRKTAEQESDKELVARITGWEEFRRPLDTSTRIWRVYLRINRQEAYRRGLKVP